MDTSWYAKSGSSSSKDLLVEPMVSDTFLLMVCREEFKAPGIFGRIGTDEGFVRFEDE